MLDRTFSFVRRRRTIFLSGLRIPRSHSRDWELPVLPFLVSVRCCQGPDFGHSNRCALEAHCFHLHFPDVVGSIFQMLSSHVCVFVEVSVNGCLWPIF